MSNLPDLFNVLIADLSSNDSWPSQSESIVNLIWTILIIQFAKDRSTKYKNDAKEVMKPGKID